MASPDHPVNLPLLNKDYQDPYLTSQLTSTSTSFEKFVGSEPRIREEVEEWDDDVEKIGTSYEGEKGPVPQNPRRFFVSGNQSILRISCYGLHVLLIVVHCVLLIASQNDASFLQVPTDHQRTLSIITTTLSQAFAIIYLTLLVYLTQQLSLRCNLSAKQTLTATHDNSTAWTGLGSALASLWSQTTIPASVGPVTAITLYLICTATLKISTPSWFTVVSFPTNVTNMIQTDIGSPFITFPDDSTFAATSSSLPYISLLPTTSLLGNTLFDVLSDNNGTGSVNISTTTISVTCGELPFVGERAYLGQNDTTESIMKDNDDVTWLVSVPVLNPEGGQVDDYEGYLSTMAPNTLQIISNPEIVYTDGYTELEGPNIIIIASTPIRDSTGSEKSVFNFDVPMYPRNSNTPLYRLQAIGCTLSITNGSGLVDSQSKKLVTPPTRKTESTWSPWKPPKNTGSWLIDAWREILTTGMPSSRSTTGKVYLQYYDLSGFVKPFLSVTEVAIMDDVGYLPKNKSSMEDIDHNPILVHLHDLENALENVTAALLWSASHLGESEVENPQNRTGWAKIQQPMFVSHLKLNFLPIIAGLCTSIILLLLAIRLVGIKEPDLKPPVERVGMLHMFWLSGIGSVAQERIARVEEPTTQSLRKAGMFEMKISDGSVCIVDIVEDAGILAKREQWDR